MSSPISSPRAFPAGSSGEDYQLSAEEALNNPVTAYLASLSNQQASTIARCNSSESYAEQNSAVGALPSFEALPHSPRALAGGIVGLFEAGGINHNFTPAEAQEFTDTMRAIQKPTGNKITRNTQEGTSKIEFRPQHGLSDFHGLGLFLEQEGKFAGCTVRVNKEANFNGEKCGYACISVGNHTDLLVQQYEQLWEDRGPENSEEYKIPARSYAGSTTNLPYKKRTADEREKHLSYQKRLFQRAINIMNNKWKESDEEIPFDPAFRRIAMMTDKECIDDKVTLATRAKVMSIYFEYKMQIVPSSQEKACTAKIKAMPTCTIDEVMKAIETDLRDHPIEMVDLHQISHLLEKLGGYASSSALVEREYTIDGKECYCTAIVLRNRQDLVDKRYEYLWEKYSSSHSLSHEPPKCNYPVPFFQDKKTSEEAQEQLSSQKQLLKRAVEKMYIDGVPFDPLFERIYVPTEQERINNGVSVSNLAQTDTILFVYRTSEERPPKYPVEPICKIIKTMAQEERIETPLPETSLIRTATETFRFFLSGRQNP